MFYVVQQRYNGLCWLKLENQDTIFSSHVVVAYILEQDEKLGFDKLKVS